MAPTETAAPTKWAADSTLGKIQAKRFNDAFSAYQWEAKTIREITDFGEHCCTPMFMGTVHRHAAPKMAAILERYSGTVSAKNYQDIVRDIQAAQAELAADRQIVDRRSTPEERAEREAAKVEREAKEKAEAERLSKFVTHTYDVVEAAAALKRVLSTIWPTIRFSVKSDKYSGGYSVTPSWIDGPTGEQVRKITDWFSNKHFDGMRDLETTTDPSEWNGHRFDIRGGYVHGSRSTSADLLRQCAERFKTETGLEVTIKEDGAYAYVEREWGGKPCGFSVYFHDSERPEGVITHDDHANHTAADLVGQLAHHTATVEPAYPLERDTVFRILLGEITPAAPVSNVGQTEGGAITVSENEERDGVEIRFADKPETAVLDRLKANGWRWSRFSKCWYHKRTPQVLAFAREVANAL